LHDTLLSRLLSAAATGYPRLPHSNSLATSRNDR
jgi:hypothetical protein